MDGLWANQSSGRGAARPPVPPRGGAAQKQKRRLLHLCCPKSTNFSKTCVDRLRTYLPEYDKWVDNRRISQEMSQQAIARAEPHLDEHTRWPKQQGATSVYLLVKELLAASRS